MFGKSRSAKAQASRAESAAKPAASEKPIPAERTAAPQREPVVENSKAPVAERLLSRDTPAPWREGVSVGRVDVPAADRAASAASPPSLERLPPVADEAPRDAAQAAVPVLASNRLERLPPIGIPSAESQASPELADVAAESPQQTGELPDASSTEPRPDDLAVEQPGTENREPEADAEQDAGCQENPCRSMPSETSLADAEAASAETVASPPAFPALDASGTGGLIGITPELIARAGLRPSAALLAAPEFPETGLSILRPALPARPTFFVPLEPNTALTDIPDPIGYLPEGGRCGVNASEGACRLYARPRRADREQAERLCRVDDGPCWPSAALPGDRLTVRPPRRPGQGLTLLGTPGFERSGLCLFQCGRATGSADPRRDAVHTTSHQAEVGAAEHTVQWAAGDDEVGGVPAAASSRPVPPPAKAWSGRLMTAWVASVRTPAPDGGALVCHRELTPIDMDRIGAIHVVEDADELVVLLGKNRLLRTSVEVRRAAIDDTTVCEVIQLGPNEVSLVARAAGTTFASVWFGDEQHPVTYVIHVPAEGPPEAGVNRLRVLESVLADLFPGSRVTVHPDGPRIVVAGYARDTLEASEILSVVRETVGRAAPAAAFSPPPESGDEPPAAAPAGAAEVVNLLSIPGQRQVAIQLEMVRVASPPLLESETPLADHPRAIAAAVARLSQPGAAVVLAGLDREEIRLGLNALERQGSVQRVMAPSARTDNERPARFAGEAPLVVTPSLLGDDRLRLAVVAGTASPASPPWSGLFELYSGQTLALASPMAGGAASQGAEAAPADALPGIVFFVTPELVAPDRTADIPLVPGDRIERTPEGEIVAVGLAGDGPSARTQVLWEQLRKRYSGSGTEALAGPFGHRN